MEKITNKEYIFIFNSIHRVMKAERILKKGEIKFTLMPVPRQLSSDCGLCIRYNDNDNNYDSIKDRLVEQFADKVIAYEKMGDGYKKIL